MGESLVSAMNANALPIFAPLRETILVEEARRRGVQTIALILDNGPTHAPKQLPKWGLELASRSGGKLTVQLYWLPVNARLSRSD